MSLNYDLTKIENYEEKCFIAGPGGGQTLNPHTQDLVFLAMHIGMGAITKDNHKEFFRRVSIYEWLFGPHVSKVDRRTKRGFRPVLTTLQKVEHHIGLETNVAGTGKASWNKIVERWVGACADDGIRVRALRRKAS
jgi:hypothetical protein